MVHMTILDCDWMMRIKILDCDWLMHIKKIRLRLDDSHQIIRLRSAEIYTRILDCDLSSANMTVIGSMSKK